MRRCPNCNSRINTKAKYCSKCGSPIIFDDIQPQKKKYNKAKIALIILIVLLIISILTTSILFFIGNQDAQDNTNEPHRTETTTPAFDFIDDPEQISEAAKSVVKLNCYDKNGILICTGSGFSVFEEGVIVTNYHVIEDFPARIEIETELGQKCDITGGIGASAERDIAILLYQHRNTNIEIPRLQVGDSTQMKKGEKVVAIGSPLGLVNTVSSGVYSGRNNIGDIPDIQFTASISHGSSGGALFNNGGEVIGITTGGVKDAQNLNFAVPIEFAKTLWENERSHRYSLNLFYDSLTPHYSVDYVLKNYNKLTDSTFFVDCYVSSYNYDESSEIAIAFCVDSYEKIYNPNEKDIVKRFEFDNERYSHTQMIMVVGKGYWTGQMFTIPGFKKTSIKCSGISLDLENDDFFFVFDGLG